MVDAKQECEARMTVRAARRSGEVLQCPIISSQFEFILFASIHRECRGLTKFACCVKKIPSAARASRAKSGMQRMSTPNL